MLLFFLAVIVFLKEGELNTRHQKHQQEAVASQTSLNESRAKIVSLNTALERNDATMKNMVEEHEEHLCLLEAQVEEAQAK